MIEGERTARLRVKKVIGRAEDYTSDRQWGDAIDTELDAYAAALRREGAREALRKVPCLQRLPDEWLAVQSRKACRDDAAVRSLESMCPTCRLLSEAERGEAT